MDIHLVLLCCPMFSGDISGMTFMRMGKILKTFRILRMMRIVRMIRMLRTATIPDCLKELLIYMYLNIHWEGASWS